MSLNPGGSNYVNWNYSNTQRDDYSLEFFGTVVAIQEVQARDWTKDGTPGKPATWPDGHPVMNIRIAFADPDGKLKTLTFQKASKKKAQANEGLHMQLFNLANRNMLGLIGKTLHLWTWPAHPDDGTPLAGQPWRLGNPRLFGVEEWAEGQFELAEPLPDEFKVAELLLDDGAHGGQGVSQQQAQAQQAPPMNGNMYAQPRPQAYFQPPAYPAQQVPQAYPQMPQQYQQMPQQYPQVPQAYPQYQQPAQQRQIQMPQVPAQQMTAPVPQGMDPAVAAAMQSIGAMNVQPADNVYDADIPF